MAEVSITQSGEYFLRKLACQQQIFAKANSDLFELALNGQRGLLGK